MNQKHCPFCRAVSDANCAHLALAVEGRDFVRLCVAAARAQDVWHKLCQGYQKEFRDSGEWSPDREDFVWLETAFCGKFLNRSHWFGGMDHEWRSGSDPAKGGYWVLLWSRDPERLWWELRDEIERQQLKNQANFPVNQPDLDHVTALFAAPASSPQPAPVAH